LKFLTVIAKNKIANKKNNPILLFNNNISSYGVVVNVKNNPSNKVIYFSP
jgi:hypothetical protein